MKAEPSTPQAVIHGLPKIDLHRHLEGSIRLSTLAEVSCHAAIDLPADEAELRSLVQIDADHGVGYQAFLAKFEILRQFFRTPEIIQRVTREAVHDAASDNVRYLELLFSPAGLAQAGNFELGDVFDWVISAATETAEELDVRLGLIASVNRHESVVQAGTIAGLATDRLGKGVVGLSLTGDEVNFLGDPFMSLFTDAYRAGLGISIHAGEWAGAENIRFVLDQFENVRIGHGVNVIEAADVIALARQRGVVFEVCLSSNLHSGAIEHIDQHPLLRMIQAGLKVTLNTDDPGVSATTLSDEYSLAVDRLDLSIESLKALILTAAQAAFLPTRDKLALERQFVERLFSGPSGGY